MSEWASPTAEAPVCFQDQGIDNYNGGVGRVRLACRLNNDGRGVGRWWGIYDASEGLETTTEAARDRQQAQGIYNNDGGVSRGRWAQRLLQQQRTRWRRIDNASKGLETMTEAAANRQQARWIGNNNEVLIFLAIGLLTVILSRLFLFDVSF